MRAHTADCESWVDARSCDCGADAHNNSLAAPVTLQSIVQTNFGTLCLSTHGELYALEVIGPAYVLKRIPLTVQES